MFMSVFYCIHYLILLYAFYLLREDKLFLFIADENSEDEMEDDITIQNTKFNSMNPLGTKPQRKSRKRDAQLLHQKSIEGNIFKKTNVAFSMLCILRIYNNWSIYCYLCFFLTLKLAIFQIVVQFGGHLYVTESTMQNVFSDLLPCQVTLSSHLPFPEAKKWMVLNKLSNNPFIFKY